MVETVLIDGYPLKTDRRRLRCAAVRAAAAARRGAVADRLAARLPGLVWAEHVAAPGRACCTPSRWPSSPTWRPLRRSGRAQLPGARVALLRPVLPVLTRPTARPSSSPRWRSGARWPRERGLTLWETALQYEVDASGWAPERVLDTMRELAALMRRQTRAAYDEGLAPPPSPFKPDFRRRLGAALGVGPRRGERRRRPRRSGWPTVRAPACPASRRCQDPWAAGAATSTPL